MDKFDWFNTGNLAKDAVLPGPPITMFSVPDGETTRDRQLRMLRQVRNTCMACSCCDLGRRGVTRDQKLYRDPHVFSNQNPARFLVYGQNPGWNEVIQCVPFVGEAGDNFNGELAANGLVRDDFYIANVVRCHTDQNARPSLKHVQRCAPFVAIEINLMQPLLVVALGAVAFAALCPDVSFNDGLGTITDSTPYGVPVFAINHPSPLNLRDNGMRAMFKKQMRVMCVLVRRLKEMHEI